MSAQSPPKEFLSFFHSLKKKKLSIYFWVYWVIVAARVFFFLFSSCSKWRLLSAACELLIAVASLVEHEAPGSVGFSSCSSQALEHRLRSCGTQA